MPGKNYRKSGFLQAMQEIRDLQERLAKLASERGNLDPRVIAISQQIDLHVLAIQRFWQNQHTLIG